MWTADSGKLPTNWNNSAFYLLAIFCYALIEFSTFCYATFITLRSENASEER